ncbi:MAG: SET domain-containing protein [Rhodobacteraceae bacterium]|nr:SET domain-containing protein [Paracoccaceae bacterium]
MLLVRTTVRQSEIHGLGLFAEEDIPRGTAIWAFDPVLDRIIPEADLARYPAHVADYLETYCEYFPETGVLVLSGDNDRFTNHSDRPNTAVVLPNGPEARVIAARDIAAGEEITCDYAVIRCRKHAVGRLAEAAA